MSARTCSRHLLGVVLFEGSSRNASLNEPVNRGLESSRTIETNVMEKLTFYHFCASKLSL